MMVFMCAHARGRTEWRSSAASASMCPATMWSMAVGGRTAAILLRKRKKWAKKTKSFSSIFPSRDNKAPFLSQFPPRFRICVRV
jgi:hypothetical protein